MEKERLPAGMTVFRQVLLGGDITEHMTTVRVQSRPARGTRAPQGTKTVDQEVAERRHGDRRLRRIASRFGRFSGAVVLAAILLAPSIAATSSSDNRGWASSSTAPTAMSIRTGPVLHAGLQGAGERSSLRAGPGQVVHPLQGSGSCSLTDGCYSDGLFRIYDDSPTGLDLSYVGDQWCVPFTSLCGLNPGGADVQAALIQTGALWTPAPWTGVPWPPPPAGPDNSWASSICVTGHINFLGIATLDGDIHFNLAASDPQVATRINDHNLHQRLLNEPPPDALLTELPPQDRGDPGVAGALPNLRIHQTVNVCGQWVTDTMISEGWNELHPVSSVTILGTDFSLACAPNAMNLRAGYPSSTTCSSTGFPSNSRIALSCSFAPVIPGASCSLSTNSLDRSWGDPGVFLAGGLAPQFTLTVSVPAGENVPTSANVVISGQSDTLSATVEVGLTETLTSDLSLVACQTYYYESSQNCDGSNPSPGITNPGDALTYHATVSNLGPDVAPDAHLSIQLPYGITAVSNTTSQGQCWTQKGGAVMRWGGPGIFLGYSYVGDLVSCSLGSLGEFGDTSADVNLVTSVPANSGTSYPLLAVGGSYCCLQTNFSAYPIGAQDSNRANNQVLVTTSIFQPKYSPSYRIFCNEGRYFFHQVASSQSSVNTCTIYPLDGFNATLEITIPPTELPADATMSIIQPPPFGCPTCPVQFSISMDLHATPVGDYLVDAYAVPALNYTIIPTATSNSTNLSWHQVWAVVVTNMTHPHPFENFVESGLPDGTFWDLGINGTKYSSPEDTNQVMLANGSYSYTISSIDMGNGTRYVPSIGSGVVTFPADQVQSVTFVRQYELNVSTQPSVPGGTTTPSGVVWANASSPITLTATPARGYAFAGWNWTNQTIELSSASSQSTVALASGPGTIVARFQSTGGSAFLGGISLWWIGGGIAALAVLVVIVALARRRNR